MVNGFSMFSCWIHPSWKTKSDIIPVILAGEAGQTKIPLVLGFGMPVVITVTASRDEGATATKSQNATVLLIFVLPK